jgi:hypothetical protein
MVLILSLSTSSGKAYMSFHSCGVSSLEASFLELCIGRRDYWLALVVCAEFHVVASAAMTMATSEGVVAARLC